MQRKLERNEIKSSDVHIQKADLLTQSLLRVE